MKTSGYSSSQENWRERREINICVDDRDNINWGDVSWDVLGYLVVEKLGNLFFLYSRGGLTKRKKKEENNEIKRQRKSRNSDKRSVYFSVSVSLLNKHSEESQFRIHVFFQDRRVQRKLFEDKAFTRTYFLFLKQNFLKLKLIWKKQVQVLILSVLKFI